MSYIFFLKILKILNFFFRIFFNFFYCSKNWTRSRFWPKYLTPHPLPPDFFLKKDIYNFVLGDIFFEFITNCLFKTWEATKRFDHAMDAHFEGVYAEFLRIEKYIHFFYECLKYLPKKNILENLKFVFSC